MARILLLGAHGMLGSALHRVLMGRHVLTMPGRTAFDILQQSWDTLPLAGQDWVINAAGLIPRRKASAEQSWIVNAVFPQALSAACLTHGARLLHISTDCVFVGRNGPHDETTLADARDVYGYSKALGEPASAMVLRTSIVGPENQSSTNLLCWILGQKFIDGYVNHLWNGVTTWTLANLILTLIDRDVFRKGVHHVHGETITKHDLIRLVCEAWRHDILLRPTVASSPRDQRLIARGDNLSLLFPIPSLQEQLQVLAAMSHRQGHWRDDSVAGGTRSATEMASD